MKNLKWVVLPLLISVISYSSCIIIDDDHFGGCVRGSGDLVTEELALDDFSNIKLSIAADVYLTQGEEQLVTVEGKQNIIDELNRDISGNTWKIKGDHCLRNIGNMKIFITIPDIDELTISGSGRIQSENLLLVNHLDLSISGSGDFDLAVEANKIDCRTTGSGSTYLEGETNDLEYNVSGTGDLSAFNLKAKEAEIRITGSGDADVWVLDYLKVRISGSGDVYYKGHPELNVSISGSGDVVDAN